MKLYKDDLSKFYELFYHYNPLSANTGVIGDKKRFKEVMKPILKTFPKDTVMITNKDKTKYSIFANDNVYSYIQLEDLDDLGTLYFRKYL